MTGRYGRYGRYVMTSVSTRGRDVCRTVGLPAPVNLARDAIAGVPWPSLASPCSAAHIRSREELTPRGTRGMRAALAGRFPSVDHPLASLRAPALQAGGLRAIPLVMRACELRGDALVTPRGWSRPAPSAERRKRDPAGSGARAPLVLPSPSPAPPSRSSLMRVHHGRRSCGGDRGTRLA